MKPRPSRQRAIVEGVAQVHDDPHPEEIAVTVAAFEDPDAFTDPWPQRTRARMWTELANGDTFNRLIPLGVWMRLDALVHPEAIPPGVWVITVVAGVRRLGVVVAPQDDGLWVSYTLMPERLTESFSYTLVMFVPPTSGQDM